MNEITLDSLKETLDILVDANPHARNKGDDFKNWSKDNFNCDARISFIKEQRQITNRVSEQFRYFAPVVVFVCVPEVKRETLMGYILDRVYKELETVAIIGLTSNGATKSYSFEQLITFKKSDFADWAAPFFDKVDSAKNLSEQLGQPMNFIYESEIDFAWYVGTTGNDENGQWHDFSEEYINDGVWENGWDDKFIDLVNSIQIGDRIAIKSTFTQKKNLPFNNHGKTVGAMYIKAIGVVTGNSGDGKHIQVDWTRLDPFKKWYGPGTLRETIHCVSADEGIVKKQLLEFTFGEEEQDYSLCEEKYNDELDDTLGVDDVSYGIEVEEESIDESKREKGGENVILYGVPGSGKSWTIAKEYCNDEDKIERLVFHPDYMYSDFVGQILPVPKDGKVDYKFVPGPFTKILDRAYHDPANSYYLIIEEINRGNAPAIFGDIFQLLDRISEDKDGYKEGTSEYPITNENIAKEVYGNKDKKVRIPSNLSIIGTMNTSDQNVFTLDNAFQRRWNMRLIRNSFTNHPYATKGVLDTTVSWQGFCETINAEILRRDSIASSEDKRLGAYFVALSDLIWNKEEDTIKDKDSKEYIKAKHKNARFAEKVLKYLWDDAFKFNHPDAFVTSKGGKDISSLEVLVDCFSEARRNERFEIFEDTIKEALLEANPKADPKFDADSSPVNEEQEDVIDGGTAETTSAEQTVDIDGGNASNSDESNS